MEPALSVLIAWVLKDLLTSCLVTNTKLQSSRQSQTLEHSYGCNNKRENTNTSIFHVLILLWLRQFLQKDSCNSPLTHKILEQGPQKLYNLLPCNFTSLGYSSMLLVKLFLFLIG